MQRMCPPPDGDDAIGGVSLTNLRYGDTISYLTNIFNEPYDIATHGHTYTEPGVGGRTYTRHCFHNRSLQSPIHFASITDFYPRNEFVHHWNDSEVNTPYNNKAGEEWNQEKHPESFYQLCVAERAKKTLCCQGTSRAPCQPDSQRHLIQPGTWPASTECKYPGWNPSAPGGKGFCTDANDVTNGCDCHMCFGDNHDPDTWVPQIDTVNHFSEYFFFHEVILNVRKQRLKPKPQPPKSLTLNPVLIRSSIARHHLLQVLTMQLEPFSHTTHAHNTRTPSSAQLSPNRKRTRH